MVEQAILLKLSAQNLVESPTSQLRQTYQVYQRLFQLQTAQDQEFLRNQASYVVDSIMKGKSTTQFSLPEHVICLPIMDCAGVDEKLPQEFRHQNVGSLMERIIHSDLLTALLYRLSELEKSSNQAVSAAAGLILYSMALHLINQVLPAGRAVIYAVAEDEDIPNQPVRRNNDGKSINQADEFLERQKEPSTYDKYAQGFFMPQWVVVDDRQHLLVDSVQVAEAQLEAMRRYLSILNMSIRLAPYMVVDNGYQEKRYGILGQLVNQGRALANYEVSKICETILHLSELHNLDRGFSLSLPYFNDQTFSLELLNFDVIPRGRTMFVPAFLVLAVRAQGAKVIEDTRFNRTTRMNLVKELYSIERAFLR